jgi:hypothetical protein
MGWSAAVKSSGPPLLATAAWVMVSSRPREEALRRTTIADPLHMNVTRVGLHEEPTAVDYAVSIAFMIGLLALAHVTYCYCTSRRSKVDANKAPVRRPWLALLTAIVIPVLLAPEQHTIALTLTCFTILYF